MTDELPKIFDELVPPPAPPELRLRVLAAVDRELKGRKPRWERALELTVAASFVLGVGLNAWQFSTAPLGIPAPRGVAAQESTSLIEELALAKQSAGGHQTRTKRRVPGPFDARYAELLAELVEKAAG